MSSMMKLDASYKVKIVVSDENGTELYTDEIPHLVSAGEFVSFQVPTEVEISES